MRPVKYGSAYLMSYDTVVVQKNYTDEIFIQSFESIESISDYFIVAVWKIKTLKHGTT